MAAASTIDTSTTLQSATTNTTRTTTSVYADETPAEKKSSDTQTCSIYASPSPKSMPPFNLDAFLKKHLKFTKDRVKYKKDELMSLIHQAKDVLKEECKSILTEIKYLPINIVGDVHGQWRDLLRIFNILGAPGSARYLFLGDYVDRGRRSVEVISLLLALKIKFRTKVYLLRGNHECAYINYYYGFFDDLKRRFDIEEAVDLWKEFNALFNYLPLAGLVVGKVLCMHGGISPELRSLDQLRQIPLPTKIATTGGLTLDLLWSDPRGNEKGFTPNEARECSYYFGSNAVKKACQELDIDMIVRAHQAFGNGFGFFAKQHLVTIFSAPRYMQTPGWNSLAAILRINNKYEFSLVLLHPTTKQTKGKFLEHFNLANSRMTTSMDLDEVTKMEKMPKDWAAASQISGEMPEVGSAAASNTAETQSKQLEEEKPPVVSEEKSEMKEKLKPEATEEEQTATAKKTGTTTEE